MSPTVSIIMPTFNRAAWLPVSIGSITGQSYADWELIVVDDGSTDDSRSVVEAMHQTDPRIRYVTNRRRKGMSGARNQGLEEARGRYLAFLDSDDAWAPFHLHDMVRYLDAYPGRIDMMSANPLRKDWKTGAVLVYDEIDLTPWRYEKLEDAYLLDREQLLEMAVRSRIILTQALVARREVFEMLRWDEELLYAPDCLLPFDLACRKPGIGHLQRYHVVYWAHDDNSTNASGRQETSRRIAVNLDFERFFHKVLQSYPLDREQRRHIERNYAEHCVWLLAYNGFLPTGDYRRAREYIRKGIRVRPWDARYWKTYLATFLKQFLHRSEAA